MNQSLIRIIRERLRASGFIGASSGVLVGVLLGEQLLTAVVGVEGGLWPAQSAILLHLLIVGQVLLDGIGLGLLLVLSDFKLLHARVFIVCIAGLCVAAIVKNVHVSPTSAASDLLRLLVPLLWVALTPIEDFSESFVFQVRQIRFLIVGLLALQVVGLIAGRLFGWGAAYLSGNPLVGFLVFPILVDSADLVALIAVALLAMPLLIFSLKRTAWLSTAVVIVLIALGSLRGFTGRTQRGLFIAVLVAIGIAVASVYGLGSGSQVAHRATSLKSIAGNSSSDYSFDQRVEEINAEIARLRRNAPASLLVGLPSDEVRLPNGQVTHAIHVTPLFLLFGGGLLWVFAFVAVGRRPLGKMSGPQWLITLVAIGALLDSLGGNSSLAPSFGFALAIAQMQVRRLLGSASESD